MTRSAEIQPRRRPFKVIDRFVIRPGFIDGAALYAFHPGRRYGASVDSRSVTLSEAPERRLLLHSAAFDNRPARNQKSRLVPGAGLV